MKVVHIINRLIGGGAEVIVPLIHRAHCEVGIDSWIVSMETNDNRGTPKVISFGRRFPRWREPFILRKKLKELEERICGIDIIHTHLTQSRLFAKFAVQGLRSEPVMVTNEHDSNNRRRTLPFGRKFDRFLYGGYREIICVSDGVQESLVQWLPELAGRTVTIRNGIDLSKLPRNEKKKLGSRPVRFLSVGRLVPKKNFSVTIQALAAFKDLDWEYTIVGDGKEREELETLAVKLGVANRVRFTGYVEDVMPFYAANDAFLLPSLWEGFGLVAAEAMGAGLIVFASDVPGLAEVVGRDEQSGILLSPKDPEIWRKAIEQVFADRQRLKNMSERAHQRAKDFSIDRTASDYLEHYRELLECQA